MKSLGVTVFFITAVGIITASVLAGCATPGKRMQTEPLQRTDMPGIFTLILYGGNYSDDLETVAFLDREGDAYAFDIYAPDFNYRAIQGLSAQEGMMQAKEFVSAHSSFHQFRLSSIVDEQSVVVGFEVRPLYLPFTYGTDDVLDIVYTKKGDKIVVIIRLTPSVENMKMRDDIRSE